MNGLSLLHSCSLCCHAMLLLCDDTKNSCLDQAPHWGKKEKKSYFTLFFPFSPTAEPGPRLEWYRISQIFQLVYASLSLVNSKLAFR